MRPLALAALLCGPVLAHADSTSARAPEQPAAQQRDYVPYGRHDLEELVDPDTLLLDTARFDRALADLARHAQNYPPRFEDEDERGRAKADLERLGAAIARVTAPREGPEDDAADTEEGLLKENLLRAGRLWAIGHNLDIETASKRALAAYERLLDLDPDHAEGHFQFGAFLGGTAVYQRRAVTHLERAVELGHDGARRALGITYLMLGEQEEALTHLEEYARRFPQDDRVKQLIAAIREGRIERKRSDGE